MNNPIPFDLRDLKPSTESISLRLPAVLLNQIKMMALKRDVPYQSLMKVILADAVHNELYGTRMIMNRGMANRKK